MNARTENAQTADSASHDLILAARAPMALVWGSNTTLLYNDTSARVLGTRHPNHLGRPLGEGDPEQLLSVFYPSGALSPIHELADRQLRALFEETRNRVHCIAAVHEQQSEAVDIPALARRLAAEVASFYECGERVRVSVQGGPAVLEAQRAVPFGLLLHELVSNSCKHAFPERSHELTILPGPGARIQVGFPASVQKEATCS